MQAMNEWARVGAASRLAQLGQERAVILKAFPELRHARATVVGGSKLGRPKRRFSEAARKRMSAGMRKYWARRKASAAKS
jgi:hypothetical protein